MSLAQWYFDYLKRLYDEKRIFEFYFFLWGIPQLTTFLIITVLYWLNIW